MKIRITIILFLLFLSFMPAIAMAGNEGELKVEVEGDMNKDSEIIVYIKANNISSVGGVEIELPYDNSKLEYVSGTLTKEYTCLAESIENIDNSVKLAMVFENAINEDVTFAEIKFKILASDGETVKLSPKGILADIDSYAELNISTVGTEFVVGENSTTVIWIIALIVIVAIMLVVLIRRKNKHYRV